MELAKADRIAPVADYVAVSFACWYFTTLDLNWQICSTSIPESDVWLRPMSCTWYWFCYYYFYSESTQSLYVGNAQTYMHICATVQSRQRPAPYRKRPR